jgi:hypothetical protein
MGLLSELVRAREEDGTIESSGWARIDTAPRDGSRIVVWGTQSGLPDSKPFAAIASFDDISGWVAADPTDNMRFQLIPTHWLPLPPPPTD